MRIGFFDSGIGGMTVLHQALKYLPNEDYIFYADTLNIPYGEKSKEEVRDYIFQAVDFMVNQGIKALVIACNTATSIAVDDLRQKYNFPILGIEPAVKPAVQSCEGKRKKVLVFATNLTLREEKFHNLVKSIDHHDIVESVALPGLVQFAENLEFREEKVVPYLKETLGSFDLQQYGTVVLGCTHFPYFENSIKELFPEEVDIISGSIGTAKNLKRILEARNQMNDGTGEIIYYKSGYKVEDKETLSSYKNLLVMLDELQLCHLNLK
ncbi:glutamate racemase [Bacillus sp. BRMEA1]|uniref:glutamate racemase n=1 Tax=Neobacillus endophyticus TaxID=2738405 RepID=UPI0015669421|nr:glutamate racemase [Neobacillus endophyticus]NRD79790.1 glutamate racemase [Neobacillus endophyticus]